MSIDSNNCSGCGNKCATGKYCDAGVCKLLPSIGDIITFGHYEQDNDTTNGIEPITWRVLDKNASGQCLIISEKALDAQPYNTKYTSITWEKSTIRSWLNGYAASYNTVGKSFTSSNFINAAFTTAEKDKIVNANVPAHANPSYSTSPGNATTDKIFMLSITEANQYFTNDYDRRAAATPYAKARGATTYNYTDFQYSSNWWLRSPGNYDNYAVRVYHDGSVDYFGNGVSNAIYAVRPALWVNL